MYTIDDIQIFIMTHNRAGFVKDSIESLLNQTAGVKEITVLDNESSDNTESIVKSYASKGVSYVKTFGFLGNFNKARELVTKPYCMLFHDDDILHPNYLKMVLQLLNKHDNVSLITTRYTEFFNNKRPRRFPILRSEYFLFNSCKDFATYMFFIEHIAYAPAIYRTKDFLNTEIEYEKYNKFNDWPFMVKIAALGNSILLRDDRVFYVRRHNSQDTWTNTNVPSVEQIVNWDKIFYENFKNDKILIDFYKHKSTCFLEGKYKFFIPEEYKVNVSYADLLKLAKDMGLVDICTDQQYLKQTKSDYKSFLSRVRKKFLIRTFTDKIRSFIYYRITPVENFIFENIISKFDKKES